MEFTEQLQIPTQEGVKVLHEANYRGCACLEKSPPKSPLKKQNTACEVRVRGEGVAWFPPAMVT